MKKGIKKACELDKVTTGNKHSDMRFYILIIDNKECIFNGKRYSRLR